MKFALIISLKMFNRYIFIINIDSYVLYCIIIIIFKLNPMHIFTSLPQKELFRGTKDRELLATIDKNELYSSCG